MKLSPDTAPLKLILDAFWREFGASHASGSMEKISNLSRNPFVWHGVLQAVLHASTWQGTALAYRLLLGAVLLGEERGGEVCDSTCSFCGHGSVFQSSVRALHVGLNYPKPAPPVRPATTPPFVLRFLQFLLDVALAEESPLRTHVGRILAEVKNNLTKESQKPTVCPISLLPSLLDFFPDNSEPFFYQRLRTHFPQESEGTAAEAKDVVKISSFFMLLGAKAYEAATVESGRTFDLIMTEAVLQFLRNVPDPTPQDGMSRRTPTLSLPEPAVESPHVLAVSLLNIAKNTLKSLLLPPTEWEDMGSSTAALKLESLLRQSPNVKLERCVQFMEPSAVLSVVRYMLTRPGVIPDLSGNNEGQFNYSVSKIKIVDLDIARCVCLIKRRTTTTPPPLSVEDGTTARLSLIIKEVNVQVEHEWRIDWNTKRYGSYFGTNRVNVRGLSSQVDLTIHADDRGPIVDSAKFSLGQVEHNCKFLNSNFISELVAQTALDWFADPLTRLMQSASQASIEAFLKKAASDFRVDVWNGVVLKLIPHEMLAQVLTSLNSHLPQHGVPI